jgi:hypothetical protein
MKYFHASDLHGDLYVLTLIGKNVDAVILTGDVFPNRTRGNVIVEQEFQEEWFKTKITPFFRSLAGRPVITVDGNHDFVSLAEMLQKYRYPGDVHTIAPTKVVEFGGHRWTGHRFIPWIAGEWNGELRTPERLEVVNEMFDLDADMLVVHAPPVGILADIYGCNVLANALAYRGGEKFKHVFCGHCHDSCGNLEVDGTQFHNAATTCFTHDIP